MNREGWLTELGQQVERLAFKGIRLPPYRLTCGWPCTGGLATKARRVGECHGAKSSKAGLFELFISPVLDESLEVAGTVCHEMAHVAAGIEAKHGKGFVRICNHVGLTQGKPTSVMPGQQLNEELAKVIKKLGVYPHQGIVGQVKAAKPSTMVTLECECGFTCTTSAKKLGEVGSFPTCGCGEPMTARVK